MAVSYMLRKRQSELQTDTTLLEQVKVNYPELLIRQGKKFAFHPPRTIVIGPDEANASLLLLHELGHALCGHTNFKTDVSRVKMEREAWEKARELASKYEVEFNDTVVERELDTYRNWLDAKSRCRKCGLTCYQTPDGNYHCPRCESLA